MYLLGQTLLTEIVVFRIKDSDACRYPSEGVAPNWVQVRLIAEDDRHYNIAVLGDVPTDECPVCNETFTVTEMYTISCNDSHRFCTTCMAGSIEVDLRGGNTPMCSMCHTRLTHIEIDQLCHIKVDEEDNKMVISEEDKARIERIWLNEGMKAVGAVNCPTPNCSNAMVPATEEAERCFCSKCRFEFFSKCQAAYHYGVTCQEFVMELYLADSRAKGFLSSSSTST